MSGKVYGNMKGQLLSDAHIFELVNVFIGIYFKEIDRKKENDIHVHCNIITEKDKYLNVQHFGDDITNYGKTPMQC